MSLRYSCADENQRIAGLAAATHAIKNGELVVLPTDTLYGLGCDAFNSDAVQRLLTTKNRGRDMPVPVLVDSWTSIDGLVLAVPAIARTLIQAFWPGALSIIITQAPSVHWDLGDAKGTVMIRMPAHPVALELISQVGPLAVSSANISGSPPASTIDQAEHQLGTQVSVYLDGGRVHHALPSTIVDISDTAHNTAAHIKIVRIGAISVAHLAQVLDIDEKELVGS